MKISDYPIIKRIFLGQPRLKEFRRTHWSVRPVFNEHTSEDYMLHLPEQKGWCHEPFELYYHASIVRELRAEVDRLQKLVNQADGMGT